MFYIKFTKILPYYNANISFLIQKADFFDLPNCVTDHYTFFNSEVLSWDKEYTFFDSINVLFLIQHVYFFWFVKCTFFDLAHVLFLIRATCATNNSGVFLYKKDDIICNTELFQINFCYILITNILIDFWKLHNKLW